MCFTPQENGSGIFPGKGVKDRLGVTPDEGVSHPLLFGQGFQGSAARPISAICRGGFFGKQAGCAGGLGKASTELERPGKAAFAIRDASTVLKHQTLPQLFD